ncbi:MAG TPA: hypothetical protein VEB43_07775 [Anaeromyxobacter sp.]|nr:hypothetical protein [Anaeromyxobacter sp.]
MTFSATLAALLLAAAPRSTGTVTYVTAARAYLDAGGEDGLAPGAEVVLRRSGAPAGSCTLEAVAPHHAICAGARARAGDTFALADAPAPSAPSAPRLLPPPPQDEVLARRRAVVEAAPIRLVAYQAGPPAPEVMPRARALDVAITHQTWKADPGGTSSKESLDVLARDVPLATWLYLDLDARLEHWTSRETARFRPRDRTQLYLWQAQLTAVPLERITLSAGRVLPWGIPGATIFDGAMAGWHGRLGVTRAELGLFGGAVPEPDDLAFSSERYTAGAYWTVDGRAGTTTFRSEGRLAAVRTPELGTRAEASLTGRVFLKTLDLSAEVGLGVGGEEQAPGAVDSARLDFTLRPAPRLRLGGSVRYAGLDWPQPFEPPAFPGRTRAGDAFLGYDVAPWLRVGATGGIAGDVASDTIRRWFGPELTFPGVVFGRGTVSAAYLEERGFVEGRSAYAQLVATPVRWLWLLGRVSWVHEEVGGLAQDEGAVTLGARAELTRHLTFRLTASGRKALGDEGDEGAAFLGFATLAGAL